MATQQQSYTAGAIEADDAFEYAIDTGRLSLDITDQLYAGNFMYMGRGKDGRAQFKNIINRSYLA